MAVYDSSDLKSTLVYIKDRFGVDAFTKPGRAPALLSDLAPELKSDRVMLERMSRLGILEDFVTHTYENASVQKRITSKALTQLIQAEFIRPTVAASYIRIMTEVLGWKIEVEIPEETNDQKLKFDSQRYMRESRDRDFVMGKKAVDEEKFDKAILLFSKAYENGNVLAGVHLGEMYYYGQGGERDYDKAIPLFVDGMHRGCPLGADWLAEAYRLGKGVPKDIEKASDLYASCAEALEAMCASGCVDAQYVLGFDLLYGSFSDKNEIKAFYWLEKAMKAGHIGAGVQVAKIFMNGWGQERDEKKGISILERYAETTCNNANFELGKIYFFGKQKERDYKKALYYFKKAAEGGHDGSQDYVGDIYYYGDGVPVDYAEARKWYELSARQGNASASLSLGFIYFRGYGVFKDKQKAFKYFKFSADRGNARAQYMLHYFYLLDENFKDYELGKQYLEKSAEKGDVFAQKDLARCYHRGAFDFAQDDEKFVYWIQKAADQDDAEAQKMLGEAYIVLNNEKVLPKSYPDAIKWLKKAADKDDIESAILLAETYSRVDGYKDDKKFTYYIEKAERLMSAKDKFGMSCGLEHKELADLYYMVSQDKDVRQKAYDHYCYAFLSGQESALYDLSWMFFINGYSNSFFEKTPEELLEIVIEEEEKSQSSNLAYLLGRIYFNGYRIDENKAVAEKWYLKAIEKGSLPAACKLGCYYINERQMYARGFSVIEEAYKGGSVEATRLLGLCYKMGIGVKKSRSKAKQLFKEAADQGDRDAAVELKKFIF